MSTSDVTQRGYTYQKKCVCGNPRSDRALSCPKCNVDLIYVLALNAKLRGYELEELIERIPDSTNFFDTSNLELIGKCSLCGDDYNSYGYNMHPVRNAHCCFRCHDMSIIPTRRVGVDRDYQETLTAPEFLFWN